MTATTGNRVVRVEVTLTVELGPKESYGPEMGTLVDQVIYDMEGDPALFFCEQVIQHDIGDCTFLYGRGSGSGTPAHEDALDVAIDDHMQAELGALTETPRGLASGSEREARS